MLTAEMLYNLDYLCVTLSAHTIESATTLQQGTFHFEKKKKTFPAPSSFGPCSVFASHLSLYTSLQVFLISFQAWKAFGWE